MSPKLDQPLDGEGDALSAKPVDSLIAEGEALPAKPTESLIGEDEDEAAVPIRRKGSRKETIFEASSSKAVEEDEALPAEPAQLEQSLPEEEDDTRRSHSLSTQDDISRSTTQDELVLKRQWTLTAKYLPKIKKKKNKKRVRVRAGEEEDSSSSGLTVSEEEPEQAEDNKVQSEVEEYDSVGYRSVSTGGFRSSRGLGMPDLRRLCGRCPPQPVSLVMTRFPNKSKHEDLLAHFSEIKVVTARPAPLKHWAAEIDGIQLPPLPMASAFSQKPHSKLKWMTGFEVFNLEAQIHQQKVKWPMMKEAVQKEQRPRGSSPELKETIADFREDLEMASVRGVVAKKVSARTFKETVLLISYMKRRAFFKLLELDVLTEVCTKLEVKRFAEGDVIYRGNEEVTGAYVILVGNYVLRDELMPLSKRTRGAVMNGTLITDGGQPSAEDAPPKDTWRATAGLGLNPNAKENSIVDSRVIGMFDCVVPHSSPAKARPNPTHAKTATATSQLEAIFLSAKALGRVLEKEATRERISVLQDLFPLTKGFSERQIEEPSRVVRDGQSTLLHELFEVSDVRRHTTLWMQAELTDVEVAKIVLVIEGVVQFKCNGSIVDACGRGSLIGEESLQGIPYTCTAFIHSARARLLFISAADYTTHFLRGHILTPEDENGWAQMQFFSQVDFDKSSHAYLATNSPKHRRFTEKLNLAKDLSKANTGNSWFKPPTPVAQQTARGNAKMVTALSKRKEDCEAVLQAEWKRLKFKKPPQRVAPPGGHGLGGREFLRTSEDFCDSGLRRRGPRRHLSPPTTRGSSNAWLQQPRRLVPSTTRGSNETWFQPHHDISTDEAPESEALASPSVSASVSSRRVPTRPASSSASSSPSPPPVVTRRAIDIQAFGGTGAFEAARLHDAAGPTMPYFVTGNTKAKARGRGPGWNAQTRSPDPSSPRRQVRPPEASVVPSAPMLCCTVREQAMNTASQLCYATSINFHHCTSSDAGTSYISDKLATAVATHQKYEDTRIARETFKSDKDLELLRKTKKKEVEADFRIQHQSLLT